MEQGLPGDQLVLHRLALGLSGWTAPPPSCRAESSVTREQRSLRVGAWP